MNSRILLTGNEDPEFMSWLEEQINENMDELARVL